MKIAKKIRLYPTKDQEEMFWRFSGTSRWAWNESLRYHNQRYKDDNFFDVRKPLTTSVVRGGITVALALELGHF